jgi:hypothetical protein
MHRAVEKEHQTTEGLARFTARGSIALLAFILALIAAPAMSGDKATDAAEVQASKTFWQDRYRNLIRDAERLRKDVARERELYAAANRRNYRRGSNRHVHRAALEEASKELASVEAELATIDDEGRRAGALPGWFYQVENEIEESAKVPSVASEPPDAGRNPIHSKENRPAATGN